MHTLRVMRVKPGLRRSFHHPRSPACGAVENKKKHAGCGICDSGLHAVCRARHPKREPEEPRTLMHKHCARVGTRPGLRGCRPWRVALSSFIIDYHRRRFSSTAVVQRLFRPFRQWGRGGWERAPVTAENRGGKKEGALFVGLRKGRAKCLFRVCHSFPVG